MNNIFDMDEQEFSELELESSWNNETSLVIRGKSILDGATNLSEAIELLSQYISYLEDLEELGYELDGVVDNDYGVAKLNR